MDTFEIFEIVEYFKLLKDIRERYTTRMIHRSRLFCCIKAVVVGKSKLNLLLDFDAYLDIQPSFYEVSFSIHWNDEPHA